MISTHIERSMTRSRTPEKELTTEEWNELIALRNAIKDYPSAVHPEKMEKFTELLVRSFNQKCDIPEYKNWRGSALAD